eukprot:1173034-Amphidinium_carterae.1
MVRKDYRASASLGRETIWAHLAMMHGRMCWSSVQACSRSEMAVELLLLFPYYALCYYCHGSVAKASALK